LIDLHLLFRFEPLDIGPDGVGDKADGQQGPASHHNGTHIHGLRSTVQIIHAVADEEFHLDAAQASSARTDTTA